MPHPLLPPPSSLINTLLFFSLLFPTYVSSDDEGYTACEPFSCGKLNNISYPFWSKDQQEYCGHPKFKLDCQQGNVTIDIMSQTFQVIDMNQTSKVLEIARLDLWADACTNDYVNVKLDLDFFNYTSNDDEYTLLYDCGSLGYTSSSVNIEGAIAFDCPIDGGLQPAYFVLSTEVVNFKVLGCKNSITVAVLREAVKGDSLVQNVLQKGFEVGWSGVNEDQCDGCTRSDGRCGYNASMDRFMCLCPNQQSDGEVCNKILARSPAPTPILTPAKSQLPPYSQIIPKQSPESPRAPNNPNVKLKIIIGVCSAIGGALIVGICVYLFIRRRKNNYVMSYIQSRSLSSDPSSKDTEKGSQSFTQSIIPGVHLFSYEELEVATNYFDSSKELGEGGFGTVYFGKLRDGRSVAVKRLYENNYRIVAQFMNEIKILTRIDHPNLVKLYGCTSRHSRELLLVYEYVPNGTVADHLHGQRSKPGTLSWHIRMNIAVETASALKFLHLRDIIHRDVKTNNILLDSNFRVKVADFGLSRLFPNHVTHVSTAPQGTPGYVDPEYHECYQLTNKSDVYSFGVVLVELISSLPAVDITRHRNEINLANMAINKIHNQTLQELVDPNLGFESDFKIRNMISAVAELAFQCLQSSKDMRPSMEEVVETLRDIQSDGKNKSQPEVMNISSTSDDVVLLKDDPPPPSPDSNVISKTTTPNTSR